MVSSSWIASSRVAVRSVQDPVVPQQGHVPWMQQAEGREVRRVHQRVVAAVAWPQQGGGSSGETPRPVNKPKGAAQALALARQQLA